MFLSFIPSLFIVFVITDSKTTYDREKCDTYTGYYGPPVPKLDYIILSPQQLYPILSKNITDKLRNNLCATDDHHTLELFGESFAGCRISEDNPSWNKKQLRDYMCNIPIDYEFKIRIREEYSRCRAKQWENIAIEENIIRNTIIKLNPNYMEYQKYISIYKEVSDILLDYCYPMNVSNGDFGMFGRNSDRFTDVKTFNINHNARAIECMKKESNINDICSLIQVDNRSKLYNYLKTNHYQFELDFFHQIGIHPSVIYEYPEKLFYPLIKCLSYNRYMSEVSFTSTLGNFIFHIAYRLNMQYRRDFFNVYGSDNIVRYENHDRMCLSEDIKFMENYFDCFKHKIQPEISYFSHDNVMTCSSDIADISVDIKRNLLCNKNFISRNDLLVRMNNSDIYGKIARCLKDKNIGECKYDGFKDMWLVGSYKVKSDPIRTCQESENLKMKKILLNGISEKWRNYCPRRYSSKIVTYVNRAANCFLSGPSGQGETQGDGQETGQSNEMVTLCYKKVVRSLISNYDKDYLLCNGFDTIIIRVSRCLGIAHGSVMLENFYIQQIRHWMECMVHNPIDPKEEEKVKIEEDKIWREMNEKFDKENS